MYSTADIPPAFLDPIRAVVEEILQLTPRLGADRLMLVGAFCRDAIHTALGYNFPARATHDVDLALGIGSWSTYEAITDGFPTVGDSGIRFRVAGLSVDLMPFGRVEDPRGHVVPPARGEPLSVWAFEEIHQQSLPLTLNAAHTIRIPTVPGYVAAKLAAWLDRYEAGEFKDAQDIALALYWCSESTDLIDRLYDTTAGNAALQAEEYDQGRAIGRQLGSDVAALIGADRRRELLLRWPGDATLLSRELRLPTYGDWPTSDRRPDLINALTGGLRSEQSG